MGSSFDHFLTDQYNRCVKKITRNFLVIVETWLKHSPQSTLKNHNMGFWDWGVNMSYVGLNNRYAALGKSKKKNKIK